jgi:nodulation protein E
MTVDHSRRRIVITGMGAVSAAGVGAQNLWAAAKSGRSCIRELRLSRPYTGRIKIAAQVPEFDPAKYIEPELLPYCDPFTQFSIAAAQRFCAPTPAAETAPMPVMTIRRRE